MANWYEPTQDQRDLWPKWIATRPKEIQDLAPRFPPWKLFRMKSTGQRVYVNGFQETGSESCCHAGDEHHTTKTGKPALIVAVDARFNLLASYERLVTGIDPDDLEECDLPGPNDPVGLVAGRG